MCSLTSFENNDEQTQFGRRFLKNINSVHQRSGALWNIVWDTAKYSVCVTVGSKYSDVDVLFEALACAGSFGSGSLELIVKDVRMSKLNIRALSEWVGDSPASITLRGCAIDANLASAVAQHLINDRIIFLDLQDNMLGDEGCCAIAERLTFDKLGEDGEKTVGIRCVSLKKIILRNNNISDVGAKRLIQAFPARRIMSIMNLNLLSAKVIYPLYCEAIKLMTNILTIPVQSDEECWAAVVCMCKSSAWFRQNIHVQRVEKYHMPSRVHAYTTVRGIRAGFVCETVISDAPNTRMVDSGFQEILPLFPQGYPKLALINAGFCPAGDGSIEVFIKHIIKSHP